MTNRFQNLCHTVHTNAIKSPKAAWVLSLPWVGTESASSAAVSGPVAAPVYTYNYSHDMACATRTTDGGHPEPAVRIEEPDNAKLTDAMAPRFVCFSFLNSMLGKSLFVYLLFKP